ncbi:MAG TPA: hypothetical protein VMN78_02300 [Longimicrobiales bacterium]|nr:hypothetical protein [Longimicrobiales bacterium]
MLARYAGSSMEYVATTCDSARSYPRFTVHSGCLVTLSDGRDGGERLRLELFHHALERDGGWTIIRYYDPHD